MGWSSKTSGFFDERPGEQILKSQAVLGLVTEAMRFQQELSKALKDIKSFNVRLASLEEIETAIIAIKKKVTMLLSSVKALEHCLAMNSQTRQGEVGTELLEKREKTLHCNLSPLKKGCSSVKLENASSAVPWKHQQYDRKIRDTRCFSDQGGGLFGSAECDTGCASGNNRFL